MRSRHAVITGFAVAVTLLIPVGAAQAAPAPAKPMSQARHTGPVAGPSAINALYGRTTAPLFVTAGTRHGCPYYYACMYTPSGWSNNSPEHEWYTYGCHNIYGEYGNRWIYNNQSGSATFSGNTGHDCYGTVLWTETPQLGFETDITPVNAVYLAAH